MSIIHGTTIPPTLAGGSLLGKIASGAASLASAGMGMATMMGINALEEALGIRFDPVPDYLFTIMINGYAVALFTECDGISLSRQVEEVYEGGMNDQVHTLPGPMSAGRVSLKRGLSLSGELWDWFNEGRYDCHVKRTSVSVVQGAPGMNMLGSTPGIVKYWSLEGAFPISWRISSLNVANTSEVAFESLEIACESISLIPIAGVPMSPTAFIT